jgi:hypothetical protein
VRVCLKALSRVQTAANKAVLATNQDTTTKRRWYCTTSTDVLSAMQPKTRAPLSDNLTRPARADQEPRDHRFAVSMLSDETDAFLVHSAWFDHPLRCRIVRCRWRGWRTLLPRVCHCKMGLTTVFAPTDAAFANLQLRTGLSPEELASVSYLLSP